MSEDSDETLVRRSLDGDRTAFSELVRRYERPVYNAALRMLRGPEDAHDVVQTAFLKAFEHLASFDPKYRFYSWIYRITLNESLNLLKRRAPELAVAEDEVDSNPGPEGEVLRQQLARGLEGALMKLKPELRSVVVLKHVLGCSYEEIGQVLELPEKTVKSRLFTARHQLRELLLERGLR
jgi:RNA polymerase sigma-70 factor (ECF subfamily)